MIYGTLTECFFQWAEMLEKEFASALATNSELEATKKATAESLLKATSTVCLLLLIHLRSFSHHEMLEKKRKTIIEN